MHAPRRGPAPTRCWPTTTEEILALQRLNAQRRQEDVLFWCCFSTFAVFFPLIAQVFVATSLWSWTVQVTVFTGWLGALAVLALGRYWMTLQRHRAKG